MVCWHCSGAALDTALCLRRQPRQRPEMMHDASSRGGAAPAELVTLPGGAKLRVQVVERAEGVPPLPTIVLAADPPNSLEHHTHSSSELASRGFRVLMFEAPGFGFSTPPPGFRFTVPEFAAIVKELLEHDGERPYVLALSCVAGLAARRLAATRPDLAAALVSVQTPSWAQQLEWARRQDAAGVLRVPLVGQAAMLASHRAVVDSWYPLALGRRARGADLEQMRAGAHAARQAGAHNSLASAFQMLAHPPHGGAEAKTLPRESDEAARAGSTSEGNRGGAASSSSATAGVVLSDEERRAVVAAGLPCLAVWGTDDRSHRKTDRASTLLCLPEGTRMVEFDGVGHFPELEAPVQFAEAVADFVREAASPFTPRTSVSLSVEYGRGSMRRARL